MKIQRISINGFGVLSDLQLDGLENGLNVIHGVNGSGKTTLLQFLRGMFRGFSEARRLRLLPPLRGGHPGGSLQVRAPGGVCEIIRRFRPDHSDTLALRLVNGDPEMVHPLRHRINELDADYVGKLCAVSGGEAHDIEPMLALALRDGIELKAQRQETHWLHTRIQEIESERADLFTGPPERGTVAELERRRETLQAEIARMRQQQSERQDRWYAEFQQSQAEVVRLEQEADWLSAELQSIESELSEIECHLWNRTRNARAMDHVARTVPAQEPCREIAEIDAEIAHAQQVLRDLAGSRMNLSLARAALAGSETPDQQMTFDRQRTALSLLEQQAARLGGVSDRIAAAGRLQACVCREVQTEIEQTLRVLRIQVALMCQELGRQQSAHEQSLIVSEREGVDRCELELTRQIQRLRLRREEVLDRSGEDADRIRHRGHHEAAHCRCDDHDGGLTERTELHPARAPAAVPLIRPEEVHRRQELSRKKRDLWQQWQEAWSRLHQARTHRQQLERMPEQFAADRSVQEKRYEYAVVEQQLADAREQWESLAVLQLVLQKTQEQLHVDVVPEVIEDASRLLGEMTEGRYRGFRYLEQERELRVTNDSGAELPLHALSRGTLDQTALSFRLALWNEYGRRGLYLPLVLDDVLADSDESRLRATANVLVDVGRERQIFFFTCQEHLAHLFETLGARVQDLPGSHRTRRAGEGSPPIIPSENVSPVMSPMENLRSPLAVARVPGERVQPDEPYWLQTHSPASSVPSLGEQMARRLGALGVREVADLIELDPEQTEIPLDSLQISVATLRLWQAEARLLVCVADLTGRDAQLLAAVGIHLPTELAQIEFLDLSRRIQRWRTRAAGDFPFPWLAEHPEWPSAEAVQRWIRSGRSARTYRQARDWSIQRRLKNRQRNLPQPSDSTGRTEHALGAPHFSVSPSSTTPVAFAVVEPTTTVRLYPAVDAVTTDRKFYLHLDSPVVDAPSIGPTTAERLEKIGIMTVSHLVTRDADEIAARLNRQRITVETVTAWQQQARLVCRIPELRGHDAQVLVACGITTAEDVARYTPEELFRIVGPFVSSKEGQRLLRSAKTPDLDEVTGWIDCARHSRNLRAA